MSICAYALCSIYALGMCLLELATLEYPYSECHSVPQIFRKVTQGIPPAGLANVASPSLKEFISLCITHDREARPFARELLKHPFFEALRNGAEASHHSMLASVMGNGYSTPNLSGFRGSYKDLRAELQYQETAARAQQQQQLHGVHPSHSMTNVQHAQLEHTNTTRHAHSQAHLDPHIPSPSTTDSSGQQEQVQMLNTMPDSSSGMWPPHLVTSLQQLEHDDALPTDATATPATTPVSAASQQHVLPAAEHTGLLPRRYVPLGISTAQPHASISLAQMAHADNDDDSDNELVFIPRDTLEQWIELDAAMEHAGASEVPAKVAHEPSCSGWVQGGYGSWVLPAADSAMVVGPSPQHQPQEPNNSSNSIVRNSNDSSLGGSLPDLTHVMSLRADVDGPDSAPSAVHAAHSARGGLQAYVSSPATVLAAPHDLARCSGTSVSSERMVLRASELGSDRHRVSASDSGGARDMPDGPAASLRFSKLPSLRRLALATPHYSRPHRYNSEQVYAGSFTAPVVEDEPFSCSCSDSAAADSGSIPMLGQGATASAASVVNGSSVMGRSRQRGVLKPLQGMYVRLKHLKGYEAAATRLLSRCNTL